MTDNIEEVFKILDSLDANSPISVGRVAREIFQLFESKPSKSRLLTEKEGMLAEARYIERAKGEEVMLELPLRGWRRDECLKEAQRDLTASIVRQEMAEEIEGKFRREVIPLGSTKYSQDVKDFLDDINSAYFMLPKEEWQELTCGKEG